MQQELLFATQTQGPRLSEQTESRLINLLACLIREATMIEKKDQPGEDHDKPSNQTPAP
ncbi:MAG: hypothetical protein GY814_05215 [Gammaproteobacteria bacterium]|nr:hypothetical protein [Gammaproteobacteria bacterium]